MLEKRDFKWNKKSLLSTRDLLKEEIDLILITAKSFSEILTRAVKKVPTLRGKVIINLFYENSTRTRSSFELAGKYLSGDVTNFSVSTSSVKKGETLQDTAQTLIQMGADAVIIRHQHSGIPFQLAKLMPENISLINAGDGTNEHPTQALLDLYTIKEALDIVSGRKIAIVGDILHSRVARSNIWLLQKLGMDIHVCGPPTLLPKSFSDYGVKVHWNLNDAIKDADIVMALRLQMERQSKGLIPSLDEYHRLFGLDHEKIKLAKKNVKLLHPGPVNRGVEVTSELADDLNYSLINKQVANGVAVRMALLYLLIFAAGK
ncbi:MAG: aspartate carbamoyltransferase [Candidatus Melainabacteria bacterium RIFCSPLOWO2_02_FULL_35_15]|nr:MAG: aspartate carbamoyltransferase [Candidatus Melainabacteria bacterium RIFCSPLOWO2_12_FULL_35_11]OGI14736.1 MAG: aspartate carbamoyltransferase [Candidatus Melainabacteria bacterium RIFCSPLOWO2_02_FULL_35_15]